jgi:adenylosuccinate synthase
MRQVPSCSEPEKATFCVAAGCVVDEEILLKELELLKIPRERIIVDPRSVLVTEEDRKAEADSLVRIGSTCSGTGSALLRRMSRGKGVLLSKDSAAINTRCRVETVATLLHGRIEDECDIIVEGTQGFALSLLHGPDYPYVTSRDTTAAGFAMEIGLSPRQIDKIVMVIRTFPIRVAGTSGPFANEFSWEHIQAISGAPEVLPEYTSVTKRLRRVARFDLDLVKLACKYNCPTSLAVMGLDRLDYANTEITQFHKLTPKAHNFLNILGSATGIPIEIVGTGFGTFDVALNRQKSNLNKLAHV